MVDEDIPRLSVVCPGDVTEEDIRPFFFFFFSCLKRQMKSSNLLIG